MVRNTHHEEQPQFPFEIKKPRFTYGVRLYVCPSCGRKQHMKSDDKAEAIIKCTSCHDSLRVISNHEVDDDLYDCRVEKPNAS